MYGVEGPRICRTTPNTTEYCTWWWDNDGSIPCKDMPAEWFMSMEDFLRWNPSITPECGNFETGKSYCVEAFNEPTETITPPVTTTTMPSPTTSDPGNGIETPLPTQPGMVDNCDAFYFVVEGDNCADIVDRHGITLKDLVTWNPGVDQDCSALWLDTYICVSVIGHTPPPTTTKPPENGIETPLPTQPGMVDNCDGFHFVEKGTGCADIASANGISLTQFVKWNPEIQADCTGLWAEVYVCVSIIGHNPPPTTTTTPPPGNGIETPLPTQPGMVDNCDGFHFVEKGTGCADIASENDISLTQFVKWNPEVNDDCSGLWAEVYVCVSIIGHTPPPTTTTPPGNGIETPIPSQPGMVGNCDNFHFVEKGESCAEIASANGISLSQFVRWNPTVNNDCSGLWAEAYVCVSIVGHTPTPTDQETVYPPQRQRSQGW